MPAVSAGKPSTGGIGANARKPTHQTNPPHGHNPALYVESISELEAKRLAIQRAAMVMAGRATAILKLQQQRDPDVLDLRPYTEEISDFLLVEMAHQLRANRSVTGYSLLILSECSGFTPVGLRSLVHAVGETLRQLDCSCTTLSVPMLQVLATGIERLDAVDFSSCPHLLSEGVREFISCCNTSLTRLNLSRCRALTDDALGWVGGALGPQSSRTRCRRLLSLDISYTSAICDRGLAALGVGCQALQFLNLEGLERISDDGILDVVQGCKVLRVLSLKRCHQLTNTTLGHIGKHGLNLRTINLSGCYGMSSAGLIAMMRGTSSLQSLNLEGCLHMREDILALLATACPALQTLNLTGCQEITDTGIKTLAENMPFVQRACTYRGLEPRVDGLQIKYSIQEQTIRSSAALRLQAYYRGYVGRCVAASWRETMVQTPACSKIRRCYMCWHLRRELDYRVKHTKLIYNSAVRIQSLVRGVLGRAAVVCSQQEERLLTIWAVYAIKVQSAYRGYWTRRHLVLVRKAMERYRLEQSFLQREAAVARLQSIYRARFGRSRFEDLMTLNQRRRQEQHVAAVTLQRLYRTRTIRRAYRQLRAAIVRQLEETRELERFAVKLQSNWRGHRSRQNELIRIRVKAQARDALQYAAASYINAGVRGYFGRRYARSERVRAQTRHRAACAIQRAWRRYSEPDSKQLELNVMIMRLRESALNEDVVARAQQEVILRKARDLANRDSASETESDDDWRDFQDEYGDQFWFSPSRNERVYMRPNDHAREKSILEMPCRVLWPLEQRWFDGRITRYNWKKDRHRINYDDGDHEWLSVFHADSSRVQLFNGHCWCMAPMLDTSKRALRAAIFIGVYFQRFDPRRMFWRSGTIRAYHEPSDMFLLIYDPVDYVNGDPPQYEQEWVSVFTTENHFQVQDLMTRQWYSLSGYVFGRVRGRPLDLQMLQAKQNEGYWYSVTDFLEYDEETLVLADGDTAAGIMEMDIGGVDAGGEADSSDLGQTNSVDRDYTEDSSEDEELEQDSEQQSDRDSAEESED
ncbi:IQ calmodulin binding motif-containing protein [Phytophthora infestans]|uniref:IQ calmodulin binding motif-containing protein n=1 Tax=Phytophthora infestans TaxID=4787 RepID=A0A833TF50_PHYIN|nr:IQ calmodulin binding motif-containing protein [Phytophthora infestans]